MGNSSWGFRTLSAFLAFSFLGAASAALAGTGQPSPGQIGMQGAATQVAQQINQFHDLVNYIIIAIAVFVAALLVIVLIRFNEKANPTPSRTTHNTMLEVAWTVIPIVILVVIAIPSFKLLYLQYSYPKPDLTIKAVGNTWFWEHQYPDHGGFTVTSNVVRDEDLLRAELGQDGFNKRYGHLAGTALSRQLHVDAGPLWQKNGQPRLLSVDNEIAVPVNKVVHVLVTANDVIHNWTIPSFGSKVDAVPGRVTATWFKATQPGLYYGQCSELCGKDHAFMPIAVRVVSEQAFDAWVEAAKARDWQRARGILRAAAEQPGSARVAASGAAKVMTGQN
ncbi:MAG: cytochrome c oxidase subunit II [Hyphomicrobiaceae bacterium]|nr:cytochrome c oxidase subunit II [Hyphomicrobiaceae bacterium]